MISRLSRRARDLYGFTMPRAGTWAAEPTPTDTQGTLSLERRNSVHEGDYISTETT